MSRQGRRCGVNHVVHAVANKSQIRIAVDLGLQTLLLALAVVLIGIAVAIARHGRQKHVRHVLFAAVGKTHIGARHLQGRHQDVALADGNVGHIAGIPLTILGRGIGEVRLFPLGIGNTARALTRQIDTAGLA